MFTIESLREKKFLREVSRRQTGNGKTYYITGDNLSPISLATVPGIRLRVIESSVNTLTELIDQQSGGLNAALIKDMNIILKCTNDLTRDFGVMERIFEDNPNPEHWKAYGVGFDLEHGLHLCFVKCGPDFLETYDPKREEEILRSNLVRISDLEHLRAEFILNDLLSLFVEVDALELNATPDRDRLLYVRVTEIMNGVRVQRRETCVEQFKGNTLGDKLNWRIISYL